MGGRCWLPAAALPHRIRRFESPGPDLATGRVGIWCVGRLGDGAAVSQLIQVPLVAVASPMRKSLDAPWAPKVSMIRRRTTLSARALRRQPERRIFGGVGPGSTRDRQRVGVQLGSLPTEKVLVRLFEIDANRQVVVPG